MEFLWLWAFSLKTPISILCAVALAGCFINFLSARSSGRGENNLFWTLNAGIVIAVIWGLIYALPAPNYNVRTVVKEVPVAGRVVTKVITQRYTQDSRFDYCMENRDKNNNDNIDYCTTYSKLYMQPRIEIRNVVKEVPVYKGERVVMYTRDARVRYCNEKTSMNLDECTAWAFKMEAGPQVQVRTVHDSYQQIFDKCNATGTIPGSDPNGTQVRNERIKTCGELALRASSSH